MKKIAVYNFSDRPNDPIPRFTINPELASFLINDEFMERLEFIDSLEEFLQITDRPRIAIVEPTYGPTPLGIERQVMEKLRDVDLVIFYTIELNKFYADIIRDFDWPNVQFHIPGFPTFQLEHAKVVFNPFWFQTTAYFYLYKRPDVLQGYKNLRPREKYVEFLPGAKRPHREAMVEALAPLGDKALIAPFLPPHGMPFSDDIQFQPEIFVEDDMKFISKNHVEYKGQTVMRQSQILPLKVYSWAPYSIISETNIEPSISFFTEKIAKPILAGRLFMVLANPGYLQHLKRLGFKTFHGIINEAYDAEPDIDKRIKMIGEEAWKLRRMSQRDVIKKCVPIFKHNKKVLYTLVPYKFFNDLEWRTDTVEQAIEDFIINTVL